MAGRGVHLALGADDEARLLAAGTDDERLDLLLDELLPRADGWAQETDLAWDAIHRCLGDGTLRPGADPLRRCVLGPRSLYGGGERIVTLLTAPEVTEVAAAVADLREPDLRARYFALDADAYGEPLTAEDFEYVAGWFARLQRFYAKAARAGRAVLFTAGR
jgi:hypothetical protein